LVAISGVVGGMPPRTMRMPLSRSIVTTPPREMIVLTMAASASERARFSAGSTTLSANATCAGLSASAVISVRPCPAPPNAIACRRKPRNSARPVRLTACGVNGGWSYRLTFVPRTASVALGLRSVDWCSIPPPSRS
jgi:hypothetical protein